MLERGEPLRLYSIECLGRGVKFELIGFELIGAELTTDPMSSKPSGSTVACIASGRDGQKQ